MKQTMKDLPSQERPYEKCIRKGEASLSDSELLSVILRCGTKGKSSLALANEILNCMQKSSYPGLPGILHSSLADLEKIHGIGTVKAVQLKCIGELSKRISAASARPLLSFHHPDSIADYYMEQLRHEEQELILCVMLDSKNHFLGDVLVSRGTATAALVTPREVFMEALRYHAVGLILIHNHPSGDPSPSSEDLSITDRMSQAGMLLGIPLLDHIIIGDHRYVSFREQGLLGATTE